MQVHEGVCGPHMNGHMLAKKILRQGYYWTTLDMDCTKYVRECDRCQRHANLQHLPPRELYNMTTPWPFSTWGIDVIGKVHPIGTNGHCFILVAIDYFTKWVEAASYKVLNAKKVAMFIKNNLIYRYGVPHEIISDNGSHFEREADQVMKEFKITRHKSSPYRPQTNGAVEAANKTIETIIKKLTDVGKDWPDKLPLALWGYRTSVRTATGETPYSLAYGMEAVLPIELEVPSLRVLLENQVNEVDWLRSRYEELALLDERRLKAMEHNQAYQQRMARAFNKRIKPRDINVGDLVLQEHKPSIFNPLGKWGPKWVGPYIVRKILSGGAVILMDLDGNEFIKPVNLDRLKKYFA